MMEVLENMGKRLADMSKPVKEKTNEDNSEPKSMLKQSSTLNPFSDVDNLDSLSIIGETESLDCECTNKSYLSQTAKVVPQVFDASVERIKSLVSIPLASESIVLPAQSCEKDVKVYTLHQLARRDKIMAYKLHENEYGKFEVLAESNKT